MQHRPAVGAAGGDRYSPTPRCHGNGCAEDACAGRWHAQRQGPAGFVHRSITMLEAVGDALAAFAFISRHVVRKGFKLALGLRPWPIDTSHRVLHVLHRSRVTTRTYALFSMSFANEMPTSIRLVHRPFAYSHVAFGPPKRPRKPKAKEPTRVHDRNYHMYFILFTPCSIPPSPRFSLPKTTTKKLANLASTGVLLDAMK